MRGFIILALLIALTVVLTSSKSGTGHIDLTGTKWKYVALKDIDPKTGVITFKKGGEIHKTALSDNNPANHSWKQKGNKVIFTLNKKYVTYKGKLVSADKMKGKASNIKGTKWKWIATRIK